MKTITVNTNKKYNIYVEKGCLAHCAELVKPLIKGNKICIITDSNVAVFYLEKVRTAFEAEGYEVVDFIFTAGEQSKKLETIANMYNYLAKNNFSRKDTIVALGGGVCGDMAGFCAATYMRGIEFIQIPTSLLAQVDSSVGGKTGVDIAAGKNLVGAFHQPLAVIIDCDTLKTLDKHFLSDGMAEVIKYGCIKSEKLFKILENENAYDIIEDVIIKCVTIKRDVVSRDEKESGERMLLNFGHTFGHALEKIGNYTDLSHGFAVAIGMVIITKIAEQHEFCTPGTADRIALLCHKYGLPIKTKIDFEKIADACLNDKKSNGEYINFVMLRSIGTSFVHKIDKSDIKSLTKPIQGN